MALFLFTCKCSQETWMMLNPTRESNKLGEISHALCISTVFPIQLFVYQTHLAVCVWL